MAINVYKSTDDGAPELKGEAGSLIAVLDHCLVTGSGWTKVYSGTNKAAYRHAVGEAMFRFDDAGTASAGTRRCKIRGYMTMSDVDTGTNQFPTTAQRTEDKQSIIKSSVTSATVRDWWLYEENGFVILVTNPAGNQYTYVHVFGKIISRKAGDAYNYVVNAMTYDHNTYGYSVMSGGNHIYVARTFDGVSESTELNSMSAMNSYGVTSSYSVLNPCDNALTLGESLLKEDNVNGDGKDFVRGKLPGIHFPFEYLPWASKGDSMQNGDSTITYDLFYAYETTSIKSCVAVQTTGSWF